MKYLITTIIILLTVATKVTGFQTIPVVKLDAVSIVDSDTKLGELYNFDINADGYQDLIFNQISSNSKTIKYILGTESGFNFDSSDTLITGSNIISLHTVDWNNDGYIDLALRKQREYEGGGYTSDLLDIYLMTETTIDEIISIEVPYQVYLGNTSNPKELKEFRDFDLDGYPDMLLIGFSHVTIGWNQSGDEPLFDEITNYGYNTYSTVIFDYNQDGYPDFINDDQYWKEPVVHLNNKDRNFTRTSVNLPEWTVFNGSTLYWNFESLWLNEDEFPDLLIQKSSEGLSGSKYLMYELDANTKKFTSSPLQINSDDLGILKAIHFDNDGYTDLLEIRENKVRIWINKQNNSFKDFELTITEGYEIKNFLKLDINGDKFQEVLFSLVNSDTLYAVSSKNPINNLKPSIPELDSLTYNANELKIDWKPSTDHESLNGHVNYQVVLSSNKKRVNVDLHTDSLKIKNLESGNYEIFINAIDPLGFVSESSEIKTFTITSTSIDEEDLPSKISLKQNYPNPFNPTTTIQFELDQAAFAKLTVYDLLGRKVRELVNEIRPTGTNTIQFNATNLASGVYLYRLEANGVVQTKKLTLVK